MCLRVGSCYMASSSLDPYLSFFHCLLFHPLDFSCNNMQFSLLLASGLAFTISGASAAPHASSLAKRCTYSSTDRACWGGKQVLFEDCAWRTECSLIDYDLSTNYYDEVPDTGNTVEVRGDSTFHVSV